MFLPLKFKYHRFNVPLNWDEPTSGEIQICVREVLDSENPDKPPILYFQGGPGFESPFPYDQPWIKQLQKRFRVFLLDQRGTGLSSPIDLETIRKLDSVSHEHAIEYLCNFRSDSIAKDAEHVRLILFSDLDFNIFGQSFGGWCTYSYLSQFPNSASSALITGGFPPMFQNAHEVYDDLLPQIAVATSKFYARFPEAHKQLTSLFESLDDEVLHLLSLSGVLIGNESKEHLLCSIIEDLYFDMENLGRLTSV